MKKGIISMLILGLAAMCLLVSCNQDVAQVAAEELVSISFEEGSSRALISTLEEFDKGNYYWKYAAKKADTSNLISGQTAYYDIVDPTEENNREKGAQWVHKGSKGLGSGSGSSYVPFQVQGFSQGLWDFTLYAYKKTVEDDPSTTDFDESVYTLVYQGETTGFLLKSGGSTGSHKVSVIVSPVKVGKGTLSVLITGDNGISLNPVTPLPPEVMANAKIKLGIDKIEGTTTTNILPLGLVSDNYTSNLDPGTYKVTVQFTNGATSDSEVVYASGSVVSTVYSGLTTTVSGSLSEVVTYVEFDAAQNPDIITTTIGTANPINEGQGSGTIQLGQSTNKVSATLSNDTAQSLITTLKKELGADSTSSSMALNLSVDTTDATETTITYDIGMEAVLTYTKNSVETVTTSTVEAVADFVTVKIDLQAGLTGVSVTHSQRDMTSAQEWVDKATVSYPLTLEYFLEYAGTETDADPDGYYYYYQYDSNNDSVLDKATLYIKTKTFSPFQLSYTIPDAVAAIGAKTYTTLAAAIADASVSKVDTIIILKDITSNTGFVIEKSLDIDTNGKTITFTKEGATDANGHRAFQINSGTMRVFGGGTIDALSNDAHNDGYYGAFRVENKASLYLSDVTLKNYRSYGLNVKIIGGYAELDRVTIYSTVGGGIEVTSVKVNNQYSTDPNDIGYAKLTDCTFTQSEPDEGNPWISTTLAVSGEAKLLVESGSYSSQGGWSLYVYSSGGDITVKNGTFVGKIQAEIDTGTYPGRKGSIKLEGGTFISSAQQITSPASMSISGGCYSFDPSEYLKEGYEANKVGDLWVVLPAVVTDDVVIISDAGVKTMSFAAFRDSVNAGNTYEGQTVELLRDIDLEGVDWTPIGQYPANPFKGSFFGGGHKIQNLTADWSELNDGQGLFGFVDGAEISNLTIEKFNLKTGNDAAFLIGTVKGNTSISNIRVIDSQITGGDPVGSIAGKCRESDPTKKTIIKSCSIDDKTVVKSLTSNGRAGGFVGGINNGSVFVFEDCSFNGKCYGNWVSSFIAHDQGNTKSVYQLFINCSAPEPAQNLFGSDGISKPGRSGAIIGNAIYGPVYVVVNLTIGTALVPDVTFGLTDKIVGVNGTDGSTAITYMIKTGENFISGDVSFIMDGDQLIVTTLGTRIFGDYFFTIDKGYALEMSVLAGNQIVLQSGGASISLENTSIVGNTGATLKATYQGAGNNKSFTVLGKNANFFDSHGNPITAIRSGYYDEDGNVIGYPLNDCILFNWDASLEGWRLDPIYASRYDEKVISVTGSSYSGPSTMTFAEFRDRVNGNGYEAFSFEGCTVSLTNDVNLYGEEWTPIGTKDHPFSGVFDGQGHTISKFLLSGSGENNPIALFGYIKGNASETLNYNTALSSFYDSEFAVTLPASDIFGCEVKNLTVSNVTANTTADGWTSAAVAICDNASVSYVHVKDSNLSANEKIGGVVAYVPDNSASMILNCSTADNVTVTTSTGNHAAGILGRIAGTSSRVIVANCINNATIDCAGVCGGGIAGQAKYALVYNCVNNGYVSGSPRVAGIIAETYENAIINCINNGVVNGKGSGTKAEQSAAGIVAYANGHTAVVDCTNTGNVTASCNGDANVSGIAGTAGDVGNSFIDCVNTGVLINTAAGGKTYDITVLEVSSKTGIPGSVSVLNEWLENYQVVEVSGVLSDSSSIQPKLSSEIRFSNTGNNLILDLSMINNSRMSVVVYVENSTITVSGAKEGVTLSVIGGGNIINYNSDGNLKSLVAMNNTSTKTVVSVSGVLGCLGLDGSGIVEATVNAGACVGKAEFRATGAYVLTNNGTISHTMSAGNTSANEHTVSTITACNITINNKGTIESKKNSNNICSYALLFYNGCDVVVNQYPGSVITSDGGSGLILACGSAHSVVFHTYDEDGNVIGTEVKK